MNIDIGQVRILSLICVLEFLLMSLLWKKYYGHLLCTFYVIFAVSFAFCLGQTFCWAFNINMGNIDLLKYLSAESKNYIPKAITYTILALSFFMLGGMLSHIKLPKTKSFHNRRRNNTFDVVAMNRISVLLIIFSFPFVVVNFLNILPAVFSGGYSESYTELLSYSKLGQFIPFFAGWLPVGLLMKYSVNCRVKRSNAFILLILFLYILITLYIGGRSIAVMTVIALALAKQYYGARFNLKQILLLILFSYFGMGLLNAIRDTRLMVNRDVLSIFSAFSFSSVIGNFVGELGWSMSSLVWTMQLIDSGSYFRLGESYLYAFTAIVPNLGFWSVHPATIADLGAWMQDSLNLNSGGLGYTFVAETYANFSWVGFLMSMFFGFVIGKAFNKYNSENARTNYLFSFVQVMFVAILLKSFSRSMFSSLIRQLFFTVFLITLVSYIYSNQLNKLRENETPLSKYLGTN